MGSGLGQGEDLTCNLKFTLVARFLQYKGNNWRTGKATVVLVDFGNMFNISITDIRATIYAERLPVLAHRAVVHNLVPAGSFTLKATLFVNQYHDQAQSMVRVGKKSFWTISMRKYIMLSKVILFLCEILVQMGGSGFNNVMVARVVRKARSFPLPISLESRQLCDKCKSKGVRSVRCATAFT